MEPNICYARLNGNREEHIMKKIMVIIMILVLMLNLVGCGINNNSNDTETNNTESNDTVSNDDSGDREPSDGDRHDSSDNKEEESSDDRTDSTSSDTDRGEAEESSKTSDRGDDLESSFDEDRRDGNSQIQSGQLTAGEWNDNKNFEFFRKILNDDAWYRMKSYWNFRNWERYEFELKNDQQEPLINVKIELHDGNGNVHYTAVTDNNGYAVIYPFQDVVYFQRPEVHARVNIDGHLYEYNYLELNTANVFTLTADEHAKPVKNLDMMLMIDTTGSMADELEYLKVELSDVVASVKNNYENELSVYVSANYYRDHGDQYLVKSFPFTSNLNKVIDQMDDQRASGGGDFEEAVVEALNDAIYNHQWDENAEAKLLFLVLDAPPHHTEQNIKQIHELIKEANALGIRIIPIASSGIDKETEFLLRFLSVSTNGTYMFLTDHSGIGNNHIEPTIGFHKVDQLNNLMIKVINDYIQ